MKHDFKRRVLENTHLPASDWFDEYYTPMKDRHAFLSVGADDSLKQVIALGRSEIELYEKHGNEYGYVGFVLKKC